MGVAIASPSAVEIVSFRSPSLPRAVIGSQHTRLARQDQRLPHTPVAASVELVRLHHTKTKGDVALLHAQVDLAEKGFGLLLPLTEHEAFDLVAYRRNTFLRVQVKYRRAVRGRLEIRFATVWADRQGTHKAKVDKGAVDLYCVYCPDTRQCYYLDPRRYRESVTMRVTAARNGQQRGVRDAKDFLDVPWPLSSAG